MRRSRLFRCGAEEQEIGAESSPEAWLSALVAVATAGGEAPP